MAKDSKHEAAIPNPALKKLDVLVGKWKTVGSHPLMPGVTLHGRTTFEWMEGGAFLIMHSEIDEPGIPSGVAVFGSDDQSGQIFMLYFDERGVSRKYEFSVEGNKWKWWRDHPGFSQRFVVIIEKGGNRMIGKGELSKDGFTWERDLDLTYTRVK